MVAQIDLCSRRAVAIVMVAAAFGCSGGDGAGTPKPVDSTPVQAERRARLTPADLPADVQLALESSFPGFRPVDPARLPSSAVAGIPVSADEGLSIVRGDLVGQGRIEYVISGVQGKRQLVVAFITSRAGQLEPFAILDATGKDSLDLTPRLLLSLAKCEFRCRSPQQAAVLISYPLEPASRPFRVFWAPEQRTFLPDEP